MRRPTPDAVTRHMLVVVLVAAAGLIAALSFDRCSRDEAAWRSTP